jgi:hypothetical protein
MEKLERRKKDPRQYESDTGYDRRRDEDRYREKDRRREREKQADPDRDRRKNYSERATILEPDLRRQDSKGTRLSKHTKSSPSRRKDEMQKKVWMHIPFLKNFPENCVYFSMKCYLLSTSGEKLKDLGEVFPQKNANIINVDFSAKFGIEYSLFNNYKEMHFMVEIRVLDDGDITFFSRFYGTAMALISVDNMFAEETVIYFERADDNFLKKVQEGTADVFPASSIQFQMSTEEIPPKRNFAYSKQYMARKSIEPLQAYYKSLGNISIHSKLEVILKTLKETQQDLGPVNNADEVIQEVRRRIGIVVVEDGWVSNKYLVPYEKTKSKIFITIQGFLNLEEDMIFCRFFYTPDKRGKKRPILPAGQPDFTSNSVFQMIKGGSIELDITDLQPNHCLLFDIVKVVFENGTKGPKGMKFQDVGMSIYPLRSEDNFLNFGRVILPIFSPALDWQLTDEFSRNNPWDLIDAFLKDTDHVEMTNRYLFLVVSDDYRKVALL